MLALINGSSGAENTYGASLAAAAYKKSMCLDAPQMLLKDLSAPPIHVSKNCLEFARQVSRMRLDSGKEELHNFYVNQNKHQGLAAYAKCNSKVRLGWISLLLIENKRAASEKIRPPVSQCEQEQGMIEHTGTICDSCQNTEQTHNNHYTFLIFFDIL